MVSHKTIIERFMKEHVLGMNSDKMTMKKITDMGAIIEYIKHLKIVNGKLIIKSENEIYEVNN